MQVNLSSLRDFKELLDRGSDHWPNFREEARAIGDMVGDRGEAFYSMGLDRDTAFRATSEDIHKAYAQFRKQVPGHFAAVSQFQESVEELNGVMTEFANYCDG
jgi:hypothetical protein